MTVDVDWAMLAPAHENPESERRTSLVMKVYVWRQYVVIRNIGGTHIQTLNVHTHATCSELY